MQCDKNVTIMNITLNGENKEVPDNITVAGLLMHLNIQHQRVAVELNENIVKKDSYTRTSIRHGDLLEIVSFMGGGCECGVRNFKDKNRSKGI